MIFLIENIKMGNSKRYRKKEGRENIKKLSEYLIIISKKKKMIGLNFLFIVEMIYFRTLCGLNRFF